MEKKKFETLIGLKIAHIRALQGLSQEELAKKATISKSYVSQIETGFKKPTFKVTVKIAKALKVDWKDLAISPLLNKVEKLKLSDNEKNELKTMLNRISSYL